MKILHLPSFTQLLLAVAGLIFYITATSVNAENENPILITYNYEHELLPKSESEPLLTIFTNGKMRAVFSPMMKLAGIREAQLNPDTLDELKSLILSSSSQGLSTEIISEEIALYQAQEEQVENTQKTVFAVMDSTTTIIEYQDPSNTNETVFGESNATKKIVQKNLSTTARQYPEISVLQDANNLKGMLQNILDTSTWTAIGSDS